MHTQPGPCRASSVFNFACIRERAAQAHIAPVGRACVYCGLVCMNTVARRRLEFRGEGVRPRRLRGSGVSGGRALSCSIELREVQWGRALPMSCPDLLFIPDQQAPRELLRHHTSPPHCLPLQPPSIASAARAHALPSSRTVARALLPSWPVLQRSLLAFSSSFTSYRTASSTVSEADLRPAR